jgi:magnesium-transporting ATPase (P-type)
MTLASIVAAQVGAVFGCRTDRTSVFRVGLLSNRLVLLGVPVEVGLLLLLVSVPLLQRVFGTAPIGVPEGLVLLLWPPLVLLADEGRKALLRALDARRRRADPSAGGGRHASLAESRQNPDGGLVRVPAGVEHDGAGY